MSFQLTQKDYDKLKAELKNLYELDKNQSAYSRA